MLLQKASTQDSGRNDGEPDYDPEGLLMNLRDSGRNEGEPDYDPEGLLVNLRDGGRNDGEPDYDPEGVLMDLRDGGRNEGEPDYEASDDIVSRESHPYLMLLPDDFKGIKYDKIGLNNCQILIEFLKVLLICLNQFIFFRDPTIRRWRRHCNRDPRQCLGKRKECNQEPW